MNRLIVIALTAALPHMAHATDPEQLLRAEPPRSVQPATPPARKPSGLAVATSSRLVAVITVLEDLDGDGQDCEWALKASGRSMGACARFLPQMMVNGAWSQAVAELQALERDRAFAQGQRAQIDHARRLIERVSSSSRSANSRLFSGH